MDELPTIKKLSKVQEMIRSALKNAPPLKTSNCIKSDFIIFETKSSSNSLFDRLLSHNNINSSLNQHLNIDINKSPKRKCNPIHKWSEIKNNMKLELENKRMEFFKNKEISDQIENEECLELEDEENEEQLNDNDINDKENDSKNTNINNNDEENESVCDENEDNSDECEDNSEVDMSEIDDQNESNESDCNPFIDNEAEEEQISDVCHHLKRKKQMNDEFDQRLNISDENEVKDNVNENEANNESFVEDIEKCNELDESFNTSLNESFPKRFATQNIALSPFNTQPKYRSIYNNNDLEMLTKERDLKTDETESQLIRTELLDLCSGEFSSNVPKMSCEEEVGEDDNELFISNKPIGKAFNVDSDSDDSDDENANDLKPFDGSESDNENDLKSSNGSHKECENETSKANYETDSEELIVTEAEGSDDEYLSEEEEQDIAKLRKGFIEDEAELSGSEVSSDEEDNEDDYEDLKDFEDKEELPSDDEIKDQIERFHNKNVLDEDKRQLLIMKEMYLEDGDLHEDGKVREKKFRWNFGGNSDFENQYKNQDSDDDYGYDDEQDFKTPALKMLNEETDSTSNVDNEKSVKSKFKLNFDLNGINKGFEPKKMNSLASFVVRDERLRTIISKRSPKNQSMKPNKKLKNFKKDNKKSIFDLLNAA